MNANDSRTAGLRLEYPENLPVSAAREQIVAALRSHQVVVICGDTGSGKTTQLPKMCLEAGRGRTGRIGHTQPRRIAARAVAARLAEEMGTTVGREVGCKVRFQDQTKPETVLKVMTDGILLAEIQQDPRLRQYDTLILDEAHERSLNIDFLLGYLRRLLPSRPDLTVVITSATIDPARFSRHFDDAPVIEVSGRTYPVQVEYQPAAEEDTDLTEQVVDAVQRLASRDLADLGGGEQRDILVFLPGERYIRDAQLTLERMRLSGFEVLPLYARLPTEAQDRIFHPGKAHRVVLATNVAETSLTVPRIRFVVDTGLARISRYSARAKIQRLAIEKISRAAADQRKGRCGRLAPGLCVRLYAEEDFARRPEYTDAEILRTNLASAILQLESLGLGSLAEFPLLEAPPSAAIHHGYQLLFELRAMDERMRITTIGRALARLPVDPRIGRMVWEAQQTGALDQVLVIAAALAVQDPRDRPPDQAQAADERHAQWTDPRSDFLFYLRLWNALRGLDGMGSAAQRRWCRQNFLSSRRIREWQDVHAQLRDQVGGALQGRRRGGRSSGEQPEFAAEAEDFAAKAIEPAEASVASPPPVDPYPPAAYAAIHRALLTGLLSLIAYQEEGRDYRGIQGTALALFPGSALLRQPPRWLMAAEWMETSRVFALTAARIRPEWVEAAAPHLVRRSHDAAYFDAASGRVMCLEQVRLGNLVLVADRRVPLAPHDAATARAVFIQEALVAERLRDPPAVVGDNWRRRREIDQLESRLRRRDLAFGDAALAREYAQRLPEKVVDGRTLARWLATEADAPRLLTLSREQMLARDVPELGDRYPDALELAGNRLPLSYVFLLGDESDGITVDVPQALLPGLNSATVSWLVPGWRAERIAALLRALPKADRRKLVPVPNTAQRLAAETPDQPAADQSLEEWLTERLARDFAIQVDPADWERAVPAELRMRVNVLGPDGESVASGRMLRDLQRAHPQRLAVAGLGVTAWERLGVKMWDFDELPAQVQVRRGALSLTLYPALVDRGTGVDLQLLESPQAAAQASRAGMLRLTALQLAASCKDLQRRVWAERELILQYRGIGGSADLVDDFVYAVLADAVLPAGVPLPRSRAEFQLALEQGRRRVGMHGQALLDLLRAIVTAYGRVAQRLRDTQALPAEARADLQSQLARLVHPRLLRTTPARWRSRLPVYLQAMEQRLDKLAHGHPRDAEYTRMLRDQAARVTTWQARHPGEPLPDEIDEFLWMLEELRVSLFAQQLGTAQKISARRLDDYWQGIRPGAKPRPRAQPAGV